LGLDETSNVAYNSGETQTSNLFILLFGRDRLANSSQAKIENWRNFGNPQKFGKFLKLGSHLFYATC